MLNPQQRVLLPHLCRLIGGDLSDGELLERFLGRCDAAAFAALVRRHGPTVLGVCRRVLGNLHDAEDAFQATFLVLAQKARSITRREALGSWLYGVAYRVSLKARADAARRRRHERAAARQAADAPSGEGAWEAVRPVLDEEVGRLPEKYRRPVVLCYFEGKTYEEAARLLGWPAGTTSVRLTRARELLRSRLALRGVALSGAALAGCLAEGTAPAAEVGLLADATAKAAARWLADPAAAGVSTQVIALTEGVVKAMLLRKLKIVAAAALVVGMTFGGAGALWRLAAPAPAAAADRPGETQGAGTGSAGGEVLVAAERPGPAGDSSPTEPAAADPPPPQATPANPPRPLPPAGGGVRQPQTRIGLINMTRVLKGSKSFQAVQAGLRTKTQQVHQMRDVLKKEMQRYQAESTDPAAPASRRDESARQIVRLKRQIEDEQQSAKALLTRMSDDAITRAYREVEEAANSLARANGLELVLFYSDAVTEADLYNPGSLQRKLSQPGALVPLIVAPGMDVTDMVIAALNSRYSASRGARPR
jgi:RNA polymerase sigma factor (sigma-70 family)